MIESPTAKIDLSPEQELVLTASKKMRQAWPGSQAPPPGPPLGDDGKPEPAWIEFVAVLIMASPWMLMIGIVIAGSQLCN